MTVSRKLRDDLSLVFDGARQSRRCLKEGSGIVSMVLQPKVKYGQKAPDIFLRQTRLSALTLLAGLLFGCNQTSPPTLGPTPTSKSASESRAAGVVKAPVDQPASVTASAGRSFAFRNASTDWNLRFMRYDDIGDKHLIQEGPGGGVAAFDYDLDGQLDLFFTQGSRLPRKHVTQGFTNELFRNTGTLQQVTAPSGMTSWGFHTGCTVGDVDDDGFPDIYVTAYGRSELWHNNGDGTFLQTGESSHAIVDTWATSAALADLNGDGLLDLYVVGYLQADDDPPKVCREPRSPSGSVQCSPTLFPALDDVLFINDGQGGFVDVTIAAGIVGLDGKGLGVVACDLNGDGFMDVFVANDSTPSFLYIRSDPEIRESETLPVHFEERGMEFGVAINGEGKATSAMGIAHGDYDRDGWIDLFVTNFYLEANTLFRNVDGRGFVDMSAYSRLGAPSRSTLAFGTEFIDVDHDGWLDLIVATGHIEDRSWLGQEPYKMRPHLFRNDQNGRFTDVAASAGAYFTSEWIGRGLAIGDIDRDGDLDVVVSQQADPSVLLLNETPAPGTSVVIKPVGRGRSPRSGIGTRVVAKGVSPVLLRDVAGGGSFQSASALELHFGLKDLPEFEQLECTWPDGQVESWSHVKSGYYVAVQGRGLVPLMVTNYSE